MLTETAIPLGSMIELKKGDAALLGRFDKYVAFGFEVGPSLIMDASISHAYVVDKMIEHGWELTIVSTPA